MKNFSLFLVGIIMLVFAGMFHLYRYGKNLPKSNVEVVSSQGPLTSLSLYGNKMLGKDSSKKPLSAPVVSNQSSLPDNSSSLKKEQSAKSPEIKASKNTKSSNTDTSN